MEILLSKEHLEKLQTLIETKNINMAIADMLLTAFKYPTAINKNEINRLVKDECLSETSAIIFELLNFLEINIDDEENIELANKYFQNINCLNSEKYSKNPYALKVKPSPIKKGKYEIKYLSYSPYQLLPNDEITVNPEYFEEISSVGYFKNDFKYLAILQNNTIWMSLNPNEINTMEKDIEKATGKVLTFGLGLGYFQFICSLKEDVKEITIVEKDPNIIALFKQFLLPFFPYRNKIKIIQIDAFDFMENKFDNSYDFVYVDIWHTPNDGLLPFIKFKNFEKRFNKEFNYWLVPSLIQNLRRCFITILEEYFEGFDDENYNEFETDYDQAINLIYSKIKNKNYRSYDEIYSDLSDESLIKLIQE